MDFEHLLIDLIEQTFICNLLVELIEHNISMNQNPFPNCQKHHKKLRLSQEIQRRY